MKVKRHHILEEWSEGEETTAGATPGEPAIESGRGKADKTMKTMTPTQRLNALVEEFDRATGFRFDRITEPRHLCTLALYSNLRELAEELAAAFRAVREEAKP